MAKNNYLSRTSKSKPNEKEDSKRKMDKKVFSFFTIAFPTILIIVTQNLFPKGWIISAGLAIYQFIIVKRFLDDYYYSEQEEIEE